MRKILTMALSLMLVCSMLVMPTFATTDYSNGTQVEYIATGANEYTITVPAKLAPGQTGTVTLEGTWASNKTVKVWADETVTLTNNINAADQKVLDVTFAGIEEAGNDTASQTFTEAVSVADIDNALFGTWSGKFNYNVELTDVVEIITFGIAGKGGIIQTYQAEKGMSWLEWIHSEYGNGFHADIDERVEFNWWHDTQGMINDYVTYSTTNNPNDGNSFEPVSIWDYINPDGVYRFSIQYVF